MKYLYLIPARGGSKGIPGKNIKAFRGVPLIGHSIRRALEAGADPNDIVITTDSEEIARVAKELGGSVPFMRPAELATDTATSRDAILHAVDTLAASGRRYDAVVLLQPTSPLRTADDIRRTIEAFETKWSNSDSVESRPGMAVTVAQARTNPYYSAFETDKAGFLHISKGDGHYTRRQDAPEVWEFNGAVYVIDIEALRRYDISRIPNIIPVEMPTERSIDLDTPQDWERAERIRN